MSDELLVSQPEPDRTFSSILSDARMIIGASIATLHRTDLATKRVLRVASAGAPEPLPSPSWTPLGVGLVGRCAYSGEPYLSTDIEKDPRGAHYWALKYLDVHAAVAVPLTMQRTTIGVLGAMHPRPGYFTSEHTKQLLAFAHDVAPTIQKLWSWQDRGASLSQVKDPRWLYELRLERVRQISAMIHSLDDIEQVYECALDAIAELTWAARVFIALVDEEAGVIRGHRGVNAPPELLAETVRRLYSAPSPDEDILAYVVRTREPAFTRLGDRRLNAATAARHGGSRYALTVPLIGRSGVLGTLTAGWNHETLADPALIGIVTILADHVAAAMDTHRLLQSERRQRLIAEELNVVARRITAGLSLEDSLTAVLRAVERLLGAVSSSVYLAEPSGLLPERRYTTRYTGQPHWEDRRGLISANGPTATALKTGQAVVIDDLQNEPEMRRLDSEEVRTTAAVPIHHDDRIIGVLYANWRERRHCAPADIRLLETLATYGAVAIENARLHTHLVEKARLEEANRRAREAEEERRRFQEFVAMASHDLKGPLSIALGYAQLLRQQPAE
jgi:GAF domain-containing protein